ncbi:MAG: adenylyl-sulfate reductase [Gammaproteobacteria bacterium]|nr:adenylyl-sulfate reductase [Gammaproteobacteria bacterium]MBU1777180.1 adenylyl-sulfate reductase [Gammaproteobacteria bacterium]MBU1969902.1 adenylyl-sulfate reductase [Gammaproteobacteria bacterium]
MFTSNPFVDLSASIPTAYMQGYIILMVLLVMGGTILDMLHKKSAQYFFENAKKAQKSAKREVSGGEKVAMVVGVLTNEVMTAGEFSNPQRRISHLLMMYGFMLFVVTTAIMIFSPGTTSTLLPQLWHIGALMLAVGGYWFWFAIRVDVAAEGLPVFRFVRADLFIVSVLATSTFALIWSFTGGGVGVFFILFILSSTMLFGGVYWSKFAHMFFKPAAAFQKRVIMADGGRENLPPDYDLTDPAVHAKFPDVPQYMGKNPPNMGLCIKAERAKHY